MTTEYANQIECIHHVHQGDTRVPLSVTLKPQKSNTPIDLTDVAVQFYMLDSSGGEVITQSATGVAVDADPNTGIVTKTFLEADVATAGDFYAYFVVIDGSSEETFPVDARRLVVRVHGD